MYEHLIDVDLSEHSDPAGLINRMRENYPDENIDLELEGKSMKVMADSKIPLQLKINIASCLERIAKDEINL